MLEDQRRHLIRLLAGEVMRAAGRTRSEALGSVRSSRSPTATGLIGSLSPQINRVGIRSLESAAP